MAIKVTPTQTGTVRVNQTYTPTISGVGANYGNQTGYGTSFIQGGASPQRTINSSLLQPAQVGSYYQPATVRVQGTGATTGTLGGVLPSGSSPMVDAYAAYVAQQRAQMEQERRINTPTYMDLTAAQAQARAAAKGTVDTKYNYLLDEMLKGLALQKSRAEENRTIAEQGIEASLNRSLEESQTGRTRATEDAATANQQLNVASERAQVDQAAQFEEERFAQLRQQAVSGTLGAGIGAQQAGQTKANRNLVEQRQAEDTQYQKLAVETAKARTWEDLAKSDEWSNYTATKGKEAEKLNLDRIYEDLKIQEQKERNTLTIQKGADQLLEENRLLREQINNFIASQAGKENAAATASFYGGIR